MMKQSFYLAAIATIVLAGCTSPFKKAGEGVEYKIISDGKGKQLKAGNFFEMTVEQKYKGNNKDTVLFSSKEGGNQIGQLDSSQTGPAFYKIFSQVKAGDSIIIKQSVDSLIKKGSQLPPFMKKGGNVFVSYKILNVYEKRESADSAYKVLMTAAMKKDSIKAAAQVIKDDKAITDYLKSKNIQAVKAPKGTYVQIINPGEGDAFDTSKVLKVLYTGKGMEDGKVFDSNTDPAFGHTEPYPVNMGQQQGLIQGWFDGFSLLKKGSKAVFYIPSGLAYGARGNRGIKPDANLIFDVEVVDVITAAQARAEEAIERKKAEEQRKHMMDSMQRAQKLRDTTSMKK